MKSFIVPKTNPTIFKSLISSSRKPTDRFVFVKSFDLTKLMISISVCLPLYLSSWWNILTSTWRYCFNNWTRQGLSKVQLDRKAKVEGLVWFQFEQPSPWALYGDITRIFRAETPSSINLLTKNKMQEASPMFRGDTIQKWHIFGKNKKNSKQSDGF